MIAAGIGGRKTVVAQLRHGHPSRTPVTHTSYCGAATGLKRMRCPPMAASAIRPPLVSTRAITPLDGSVVPAAPAVRATAETLAPSE